MKSVVIASLVAGSLVLSAGMLLRDGSAKELAGGLGARVFVVERESGSLAIYDLEQRKLLPRRISGLGNLNHAVMTFSRDLKYGFLATRSGKLSRIDLENMSAAGEVYTSKNSIDIAVSQDGRFVAAAEYAPGGVTILDAKTLAVRKRLRTTVTRDGRTIDSRATGIVDVPGNRFACVLMEGAEVWIIDASRDDFPVEHRIPVTRDEPYDAMITPDGRYYVVGHIGSDQVSVIDLSWPQNGAKSVLLRDAGELYDRKTPVKLPHLAAWAVARDKVFVPLVGEARLAILDRWTWQYRGSVPLRGHPVYAIRSPHEREIWVSFSGEANDRYVQVVDVETLAIKDTIDVGGRIYHMDFTPRGSHVLVSANKDNKLVLVNGTTHAVEDVEDLQSPSGIFGPWRAFTIGL